MKDDPAYLALHMTRLRDKLADAGAEYLKQRGIAWPVYMNSTVASIGRSGATTGSRIANETSLSPQLVGQYLTHLEKLGVVEFGTDPDDRRRKIVRLTPAGLKQFGHLQSLERVSLPAFEEIYAETGHDLFKAIMAFERALDREDALARYARAASRDRDSKK